MDGPNIFRLVNGTNKNRLTELLLRMEASYYKHIMPPDVLIVLRVEPEIAVQRKKDEGADYVRTRSEEVWKTNFDESRAYVVDAGREKADVISTVRSIVWSGL
jgi:thymidylate kinase